MKKPILLLIVLLFFFCFADAVIEPYWPEVREIELSDPDIPQAFHGFRIAFLTDLHHGRYFSRERLREMVERVNGLSPDLVLLGGDYVSGGASLLRPVAEELGRLRAPHGVYAVLGNHDHWAGAARARSELAGNRIRLLDNRAFWIGRGDERIRIGGVGDLVTDVQDLTPTITDAREDDFVILVSHNPDYAEEITTDKIDVMLAGHTHGGQITFFGLFAPVLPVRTGQKYRSGLIDTGRLKVIVSNGIGTITPPLRFFARPQIVVITLECEKKS